MAYNTLATISAGDTGVSTWANQVGDNLDALADTYQSTFTPAVTATSISVTYTKQEGLYTQTSQTVEGEFTIVFNAVTAAGTGDYSINLPVDSRVPSSGLVIIGYGIVYDVSATTRYQVTLERTSSLTMKLGRDATSGFVTGTAPITWAPGDMLQGRFRYKTA